MEVRDRRSSSPACQMQLIKERRPRLALVGISSPASGHFSSETDVGEMTIGDDKRRVFNNLATSSERGTMVGSEGKGQRAKGKGQVSEASWRIGKD